MNEFFTDHPLVYFSIIFSACIWCSYKFLKTKDLQYVFTMLILASLQLGGWPFFANRNLSISLLVLFSLGFLCYERFTNKRLPLRLYVLCFSGLGVFFLVKFVLGL